MMLTKKDRVVKGKLAEGEAITSFGGSALVEKLAVMTGLWKDCVKSMPARGKGASGYDAGTVISSMVHGLLTGSQGTYAAEPLREDEALKKLLGLSGVPEEATVSRALGQWAEAGAVEALGGIVRRLTLDLMKRRLPAMRDGFLELFLDGTDIEVGANTMFEGIKMYKGEAKLVLSTAWVGPYLAALSFAAKGEDERAASSRLLEPLMRDVIRPLGFEAAALFLSDSLYGDGPFLTILEGFEKARYVVGGGKLVGLEKAAAGQPETQWENTGANRSRKWSESAICVHLWGAESWEKSRVVVTRRYKRPGEMIYGYSSVLTNLTKDDERVRRLMKRERISWGRAIFRLYDRKQACENQFKDPLSDLGLHHPPCRDLAANEVFYHIAALALNLAGGVRRIAFEGDDRRMRLWRFRREFLALPARVALHARRAVATLFAGPSLWARWHAAMTRLAAS